MDLQLHGRRVLVTGSSSGIGEAIVRLFTEEGARVVVHGRNRERAEAVAAEIGAAGVAIGELSEDGGAAEVHAQAVAALGGSIEVLINNAGGNAKGNTSKRPAEIAAEDFIANYKANMLGAVQLCQLCVPAMVEAKFGRIVNVSSAVAMQPNFMGVDYSAAKAALNNYTVSLAGSLRGVNVTANILTPGVIMVDGLVRFGRHKFGDLSLTAEQVNERLASEQVFEVPPAGRFGLPRELAMVAAMLASPANGFITGANYRVDGGQVRGLEFEGRAMSEKTYKVIQWATGTVGKAALKYFIENPVTDLVGVLVTDPAKVGKDAGDIVGLPKTGVLCTDDVDAIVAMEADCVLFAPSMMTPPIDMVCRLLASGKNVVSPAGPFLPNKFIPEHAARVEAACREGGVSFHGCGIHPGYAGDILPLTLARLMSRIDCIEVSEIIDKVRNPMIYTEIMGFGADCDELLAKPRRSPETYKHFYSSMSMIAEGLGVTIDDVTVKFEVAKALVDIEHQFGLVKAGTCGGQHYEWTAWSGGKPLIVYHFYWHLGTEIEPRWEEGEAKYRVRIHGDPPLECHLMAMADADGRHPFLGIPWTGLVGCTVVPQVCDAPPGVVSHLDLGVVRPRGLVRR